MEAIDIEKVRSKWKDRMLQIAFIVSGWSQEPEGQRHGCVIAADAKYIVATGFNGKDRNWELPAWTWRPTKSDGPRLIHAEENALLNLNMIGVDSSRCVAYVTKKPCDPCMALLHGAGLRAVFWLQDVGDDRGQWVRGAPPPAPARPSVVMRKEGQGE